MMDSQTTDKLITIGKEIKALFPKLNCNIQFNLSKNHSSPTVNINLADVTEAKKPELSVGGMTPNQKYFAGCVSEFLTEAK